MAQKVVRIDAGRLKEIEPNVTSAGAGDAGKLIALDAGGKIDSTLLPSGVGPETTSIVSSENLAAGDWVNVWNDGGTPKVRKADATTVGKEANGFVLAGVTAPAAAAVYTDGINNQVSGLTAGYYWLSTTPGAETATAPSAAGNIVQILGRALSATEVAFEPSNPVELV